MLGHSREFNDYDYALVHLLNNPTYYSFYEESLEQGRVVYLDNSLFELGTHFDEKLCKSYIEKLRPTYFIMPDAFGNSKYSIEKAREWSPYLIDRGIGRIGVCQGNSFEDIALCYEGIKDLCDIIAISFAQPFFSEIYNDIDKDLARIYARVGLLNFLKQIELFDYEKKHHLLGISLPQELLLYQDKSCIYSIDTSSPIVHGIEGVRYESFGLRKKSPTKMVDLFESDVFYNDDVFYNIKKFKEFSL
jgi:hypothetical protein